ncbi:sigma factor-like helix-turn-helix DNA-binding protein [Streptomyces purpurascens]|uniref:sigma factor-like helix-turn-helix DNA-binding protein n=1 Tax=Streptomyces purpurascens TaxID=1924 RepID=UPI0033C3668C
MLVNDGLNGHLASLPENTRHMLRMVYDGHDYAEIGETLGITAKVVTDRIYRARRRLREDREFLREQHRSCSRPGRGELPGH